MRAIVTGGAGFIGSHLVDALIDRGAEVHVIDNLSTGRLDHVHPCATLHVCDVVSQQVRDVILAVRPDVLFHEAAQVDVNRSTREPLYDATVNILGMVNVLSACVQAGVKKVVYASSSAVYGENGSARLREEDATHPISCYGISKLTPELYLRVFHQLHKLPYTILRYANVYGPRQNAHGEGGVIAIFLDRLKAGKPLFVHGDGEQTRDFVYVLDVVRANLLAAERGEATVYQVGTGTPTSINRLLAQFETLHGAKPIVQHAPERPGDIRHSCFNNQKIVAQLGWTPQYDIVRGLAETYVSF